MPTATEPKAVLLDVGGVFLLPDHDHIASAFAQVPFTPDIDDLDRAHYTGAAQLTVARDPNEDPQAYWRRYLDGFVTACGVPDELRDVVHEHLDNLFATMGVWSRVAPGSRAGLEALAATGVRLGVVSNADGTMETRLREHRIAQVGPGPGVEVEVVVDSGAVGVAKPDPAIFAVALGAMGVEASDAWYVGDMPGYDIAGARAAGLRPFLIDPYHLHEGADYERVGSLTELATLVTA